MHLWLVRGPLQRGNVRSERVPRDANLPDTTLSTQQVGAAATMTHVLGRAGSDAPAITAGGIERGSLVSALGRRRLCRAATRSVTINPAATNGGPNAYLEPGVSE